MRVTKPGVFTWSPTGEIATAGWEIDAEGAPVTQADVLACMLNHIAKTSGLHACAPPDPIAAEGLAEDVIERVRKAGL